MKSDLKIISFPGELGEQIIVEIIPHRQNLRHSLVYAIKNSLHQEDMPLGKTNHGFTVPIRWAVSVRDSVNSMLTIVLSSYDNDSGDYLSSSELSVPVRLPIDLKPIIEKVELFAINTGEAEPWDEYIQGVSKIMVKTSARGVYGSIIKNISVNVEGINYKGYEITSQHLQNHGETTVTVKVTDSRGRVESLERTINVQAYNQPQINSLKITRSDEYSQEDSLGEYLKIDIDYNYSPLGFNTNITLLYRERGTDSYLTLGDYAQNMLYGTFDANKSFDVKAVLTDGIHTTEYETVVPSNNICIHINDRGNGIGLGCISDKQNAVEIAPNWDLYLKGKNILDWVYPLGSIYVSRNNTSPQSLFGGTWKALEARFLLGASSNYPAGSMGGNFTHTLKINEIPRHRHTGNSIFEGSSANYPQFTGQYVTKVWKTAYGVQDIGSYVGDSDAHNITPPYYSVYMWERTA